MQRVVDGLNKSIENKSIATEALSRRTFLDVMLVSRPRVPPFMMADCRSTQSVRLHPIMVVFIVSHRCTGTCFELYRMANIGQVEHIQFGLQNLRRRT